MRICRDFLLPAGIAFAYIMIMTPAIRGQGYNFPTDDYGYAYVGRVGNMLYILGTTRLSEPPPWEELVAFDGPGCAQAEYVGSWDCGNPVW